jgi:hypothetical protein
MPIRDGWAVSMRCVERGGDGVEGVVADVDGGADDRSPALVAFREVSMIYRPAPRPGC